MAKIGRPWYRKGTDSWYVWHENKQLLLAKGRRNKAEAYARFAELLNSPTPTAPETLYAVSDLLREFEENAAARVQPPTLIAYRCVLKPFRDEFGTHIPAALTPELVEKWACRKKWSTATRRYALIVVCTAFSLALRTKRILVNPLTSVKKPPAKSRGAEALIDSELHTKLLSVASPNFRDFITAVQATGARPGEVARVEAKDVLWEAACWVLTEHKTAKTGRLRTIYLSQPIVALCRKLAEQHPTGPLFRTTRGEQWKKTAWKQAMERVQKKLGLTKRPLASGYRHSFATDGLEAGVPETHLAELLGHATTAMIQKHYGHLTVKGRALRNALEKIRGLNEQK